MARLGAAKNRDSIKQLLRGKGKVGRGMNYERRLYPAGNQAPSGVGTLWADSPKAILPGLVSGGNLATGLVRFLLFASIAILLILTASNVWITWHNDAQLNFVAGVWTALAADLKHGVFYRPLFGPLGFGGTRYFPLHFVLHAGLMKAGLSLRISGHLIELFSMAGLMVGIVLLLRNLGVPAWLAAASSIAVLAAGESQLALTTIRGDVLPAALNVLALALCAKERVTRSRLIAASALFSLAFAAKETTVFGVAAATLAFLLSRRVRPAIDLALATGAGYALVLVGILVASHGRAYGILHASGDAGLSVHNLLVGPYHLIQDITLTWYNPLPNPALYLLGFSALLAWRKDRAAVIAPLFLAMSAIVTVVILGSSGTSYNHLLDLNVAAVVTFSTWAWRQGKQYLTFCTALLAMAIVLALPLFGPMLQSETDSTMRQNFRQALQLTGGSSKPVLAENPLLALEAGMTPYVLDPYMLAALNRGNPAFAQPLWNRLAEKSFSEVVLAEGADTWWGRVWYTKYAFGPGFLRHLNQNYHLVWKGKGTFVYLPD
jgi:hypothetical protein